MIRGAMQHWPLRIGTIIDHAERQHGTQEVVTRSIEGPITAPLMPKSRPAPGAVKFGNPRAARRLRLPACPPHCAAPLVGFLT